MSLVHFPYAAVDWAGSQVASLTHIHVSDYPPPADDLTYFNALVALGYRHLAISNYYPSGYEHSYPLTNLTGVTTVPDDVIGCPNAEHHSFINSPAHFAGVGCLLITGDTESGYGGAWQSFFDEAAANMQYEDGGGFIINHPTISPLTHVQVAQYLDHSPLVLGIEVYSNLVSWDPDYNSDGYALEHWHRALVSGRRCYGIASSDHWLESSGHPEETMGANRLLVPSSYAAATREEREHLCLQAYRRGEWYAAVSFDSPVLTGMTADEDEITVTFADSCDITFVWARIGDPSPRTTDTVTGTTATYTVRGDEVYVRAVGRTSDTEVSMTQPVMYRTREQVKAVETQMAAAVLFGG